MRAEISSRYTSYVAGRRWNCDREPASSEYQQFVQEILEMLEGRLAVHWAQIKQVRGETSPRVICSQAILFRFLKSIKAESG